ncbi:MAG: RNA methyltransferase [Promethearchaeota archaeon]
MNKKKIFKELNSFHETQIYEKYKNFSLTIILVQPENAGNIGSIARVMKNFNFKKLIVFNPIECVKKIHSYEAQGFAMHGKDILLNAEIIVVENEDNHLKKLKKFLEKFDLVIATTAKGVHYTNLQRLAIFPENLEIPLSKKSLNIAILFGKESRGLTNEEMALCDIFLRIPTSNKYPTLNISHACAITLYEIFKKMYSISLGRGLRPVLLADKKDRKILYLFIKNLINKLKFGSHKEKNALLAFKNVYERSFMSKKELSLMTGLFSKLNSILEGIDLYEK